MPRQQQEEELPTVHDLITAAAGGYDSDSIISEVLKDGGLQFMDYAFPEEEPARDVEQGQ